MRPSASGEDLPGGGGEQLQAGKTRPAAGGTAGRSFQAGSSLAGGDEQLPDGGDEQDRRGRARPAGTRRTGGVELDQRDEQMADESAASPS
jgi:hypothetical protein